jgi:hypothetical protein
MKDQSFHRKGNRIIASNITIISSPTNKSTICNKPSCTTAENAAFEIFISNKSWGIMIGNPIIAINAACCWALAAIAARNIADVSPATHLSLLALVFVWTG